MTIARSATSGSVGLKSSASMNSLGATSSLSMLNGAKSTRSTCGSQSNSNKASAPSFSFGSGPARLNFSGAAARGCQTLQASVSSGGNESPGPIYNPAPSKKWLGDAPHAQFGTQEQRPASGAASQEISKLTGKSNTPGPGSYTAPSSVGKQALGRCNSNSSFSFGTQRQRESMAKSTTSPGPMYEPRSTRMGTMDSAAYSFGNDVRSKSRDPSLRTPGPGVYNMPNACGSQPLSMYRSASSSCFGQPSVSGSGRAPPLLEGKHSPGPIYMNEAACRKQVISTRRSANTQGFSRATRFPANQYSNGGPGPGEYVV